jgi:hypothetical protein
MAEGSLRGPAGYFAEHPTAYSVSLAMAGTAAGVFAGRALRSRGFGRLWYAALTLLQIFIFSSLFDMRKKAAGPA